MGKENTLLSKKSDLWTIMEQSDSRKELFKRSFQGRRAQVLYVRKAVNLSLVQGAVGCRDFRAEVKLFYGR